MIKHFFSYIFYRIFASFIRWVKNLKYIRTIEVIFSLINVIIFSGYLYFLTISNLLFIVMSLIFLLLNIYIIELIGMFCLRNKYISIKNNYDFIEVYIKSWISRTLINSIYSIILAILVYTMWR